MGCSESRESTPVGRLFTPSSSEISLELPRDSIDQTRVESTLGTDGSDDQLQLNKQFDDQARIDGREKSGREDETNEHQQSLEEDNKSLTSQTSEEQEKSNTNTQEQIETVDKSNGDEASNNAEIKTKENKKSEDKLVLDLQLSLKNILIKAEQKKKHIFAIRHNKSDEATIHLNRSFCDTAPVSPNCSTENVMEKKSDETTDFWDDEPIETAERDTNEDHSPW